MTPTPKHKILGLHGFAQVLHPHFPKIFAPLTLKTGQTFAKKAGALRKALDKQGIEIIFPTARHKILAADASIPTEREKLLEAEKLDSEWQYWGWAFADEEKQEMRGLDTSIQFITKILEEQVLTSPPNDHNLLPFFGLRFVCGDGLY